MPAAVTDDLELEPTAFAPAPEAAVTPILAELEPTRVEGAEPPGFDELMASLSAALPAAAPDESWLERHAQADAEVEVEPVAVERFEPLVGAVAVESLEVDRASTPAVPPDAAPQGPRACRYCRAPAPDGAAFCEACGMHLES